MANFALTADVKKWITAALTKNVRKALGVIKANVLSKNVSLKGSFANHWVSPNLSFIAEKIRNLDVQRIKQNVQFVVTHGAGCFKNVKMNAMHV